MVRMPIEQPDFLWWECPVCEFSAVTKATIEVAPTCPICAEDTGKDTPLESRVARSDDRPEGKDARKLAENFMPSER